MAGVAHQFVADTAPNLSVVEQHCDAAIRATGRTSASPLFFERRMFSDGILSLPDGARVPYWGFEDPSGATGHRSMPSPLIRMREGETAQVRLDMRRGKHSTQARSETRGGRGDALSIESFDTHIYRWKPKAAGTWLYQHHASTAEDFEMGLFGLLVVDPEPDASGRGRAYKNGPSYDVEQFWVFDDLDPAWHTGECDAAASRAAGTQRVFDPKYFLINGVANTQATQHPDVAITANVGDQVLIRMVNASFSLVKISLEHFSGDIVSVDGSAIDVASCPWKSWIPVHPDKPIFMSTGSRHDLLIDLDPARNPCIPGHTYKFTFEFLDWANRSVRNSSATAPVNIGRAVTTLTVI